MPKDKVGDGGEREAEISTAIERLASKEFEAAIETLVGDTRDHIIDLYKSRPKPWGQMSNDEQQTLARAAEYQAGLIVKKIAEAIAEAKAGENPVRAILEGYSEKDGNLKATLKIRTIDEDDAAKAVVSLHKAVGKMVLVSNASAEDYKGQRGDVDTDADQPNLEFADAAEAEVVVPATVEA